MKKIALVVQRFGPEINGGAEHYARMLALHLAKSFEIEVLTTCALDYNTWKNHYAAGVEADGPLRVRRFPVSRERIKAIFNSIHFIVWYFCAIGRQDLSWQKIFSYSLRTRFFWRNLLKKIARVIYNIFFRKFAEFLWMKEQGPTSPDLTLFLRQNQTNYQAVIFVNYHYQTTFNNIVIPHKKVILVPTAHEEPILYMRLWDKLIDKMQSVVFSTEEEQQCFLHRFPEMKNVPQQVLGIGIEKLSSADAKPIERLRGQKFVLYLGRIEHNKGCTDLFEYFLEYKKRRVSHPILVLAGREEMPVPKDESIISLGFVSVEEKTWLLENCELLILPSLYESLSLAVLEAWSKAKPVLVNGGCAVLAGQVQRSGGGLCFYKADAFCEALDKLWLDEKLRVALGNAGKSYYRERYDWDRIEKRWQELILGIISSRGNV